MPKCNFKTALLNHTSARVFSYKFAPYFQNTFPKINSRGLLLNVCFNRDKDLLRNLWGKNSQRLFSKVLNLSLVNSTVKFRFSIKYWTEVFEQDLISIFSSSSLAQPYGTYLYL